MSQDYYDILGVPRDASQDDIKRAYRKLARKFHPDVSQESDAEERFKDVNGAYEVLSDPERRSMYDRYGTDGPPGMGGFDFGGAGRDPFDIFAEVFGNMGFGGFGRSGRAGPRRGNDVRASLKISFEEAAFGAEKEIFVQRQEICATCGGNGAAPGSSPQTCPECNGSGQIRQVQRTILGSFVNITTCPRCEGKGSIVTKPCEDCHGAGRSYKRRKLAVSVPAGVDDGVTIRLTGQGEPGELNGPPGNLYVTLGVTPHAFFKRRGNDVVLEIKINVAQATMGARIKVPTLEGDEELDVPAGTQPGTVFPLRGRGIPHLRGNGRGDELIVTQVSIPKRLSPEQRELFGQLAETMGTEVIVEEKQTIVDHLKDFLGL